MRHVAFKLPHNTIQYSNTHNRPNKIYNAYKVDLSQSNPRRRQSVGAGGFGRWSTVQRC